MRVAAAKQATLEAQRMEAERGEKDGKQNVGISENTSAHVMADANYGNGEEANGRDRTQNRSPFFIPDNITQAQAEALLTTPEGIRALHAKALSVILSKNADPYVGRSLLALIKSVAAHDERLNVAELVNKMSKRMDERDAERERERH